MKLNGPFMQLAFRSMHIMRLIQSILIHTLYTVPTPSPQYTAVVSSTTQSPTPSQPSSDPGSQRGSGGSIAGGVLGASVLLTLLLMGAVVTLIVVFKFRKRRTETLEPWPQVKWSERAHCVHESVFVNFYSLLLAPRDLTA